MVWALKSDFRPSDTIEEHRPILCQLLPSSVENLCRKFKYHHKPSEYSVLFVSPDGIPCRWLFTCGGMQYREVSFLSKNHKKSSKPSAKGLASNWGQNGLLTTYFVAFFTAAASAAFLLPSWLGPLSFNGGLSIFLGWPAACDSIFFNSLTSFSKFTSIQTILFRLFWKFAPHSPRSSARRVPWFLRFWSKPTFSIFFMAQNPWNFLQNRCHTFFWQMPVFPPLLFQVVNKVPKTLLQVRCIKVVNKITQSAPTIITEKIRQLNCLHLNSAWQMASWWLFFRPTPQSKTDILSTLSSTVCMNLVSPARVCYCFVGTTARPSRPTPLPCLPGGGAFAYMKSERVLGLKGIIGQYFRTVFLPQGVQIISRRWNLRNQTFSRRRNLPTPESPRSPPTI